MHCPYCAAALIEAEREELKCSNSGALFSRHVSGIFRQRYACATSVAGPAVGGVEVGQWYCPACGVPMRGYECGVCSRAFELSLVHQLVELNPHVVA
jgi:hypothetical protein